MDKTSKVLFQIDMMSFLINEMAKGDEDAIKTGREIVHDIADGLPDSGIIWLFGLIDKAHIDHLKS